MRVLSIIAALFIVTAFATEAAARTWVDISGRFSTEADFVRLANGKVVLRKANGETIAVPLVKLSNKDRAYVQSLQAKDSATGSTATARVAKPGPETKPKTDIQPKKGRYTSLTGEGLAQLLGPALAAKSDTKTTASLVFVLSGDGRHVRIESGSVASSDGKINLIPSAFDLDVKGTRFAGQGPFSIPSVTCEGEFVSATEAKGTLSITIPAGIQQRTLEGKWGARFKESVPEQNEQQLLGKWKLERIGAGIISTALPEGQGTLLEFRQGRVVVVTEIEDGKPQPPETGKYKITGGRIEFTVWIKSAEWSLKQADWLELNEGGLTFAFRRHRQP